MLERNRSKVLVSWLEILFLALGALKVMDQEDILKQYKLESATYSGSYGSFGMFWRLDVVLDISFVLIVHLPAPVFQVFSSKKQILEYNLISRITCGE